MINYLSIGCKVNQAELSEIKEKLQGINADICVLNTCALTSVSSAKSRKLIRRLIKQTPDSSLIVTGCFVDAYPDIVKKLIRQNDIAFPNKEKSRIPEIINRMTHTKYQNPNYQTCSLPSSGIRTRAFLKIQDGCEDFCAYCLVPYLRSEIWYKPDKEVVADIQKLVADGYKEVVLTGVNLGTYPNLAGLLEKLVSTENLIRLRLSSIELTDISETLIDLISRNPVICPHLHIPLQSGSDRIINSMRRNYTSADFIRRINYIKDKIENPSITTDVIVGFPGETDDDFNKTLSVCKEVNFSKIHIFPFSPRKGTLASEMENKIRPQIIKKRFAILNNLAKELSLKYKTLFIGKEVEILIEENNQGLTERYIRVKVEDETKENRLLENQLVRVKINKITPEFIKGTLIRDVE
jgi:threonylcarbamoyladenosine tRNA methylthiotransferase MtaB